jgi:AraC-like DNA-binding protein
MMNMLFICLAYIAFCCVKDSISLFESLHNNTYLAGLSFTVDLAGIPLLASFFGEVVSPGLVTKRKVLLQFGAKAIFIPVFAIFPYKVVLDVALWCACAGIIVSLLMGFFLLFRHRKYIRDNYSYTERVDVNWAINFAVVLAASFVGFVIVATNVTWIGRTIFYLCMMLSWIYLNKLARRHSVVNIPPLVMFAFPLISNKENEEIKIEESAVCSDVYAALAEQLKKCMEEDRLYLNPKLTLQDVCSAIGTNRTYLSDYLNKVLKTTFYEYINALRISRACEIIDAMTPENKQSMLEVSEISGFNSISTFNRSFAKIMGQTPSQYVAKKK